MTTKVSKKSLRIERNFFLNLRKNCFWPPTPRRRRRRFFWTGGAPPPPTEIDRRAAADTMTSAHSSRPKTTYVIFTGTPTEAWPSIRLGGQARRCLVTESPPPRSLPPETLFRYRFSPRRICFGIDSPPGDYILKQSLRGGRNYFIPPRNKLSPGGEFISTRVRL